MLVRDEDQPVQNTEPEPVHNLQPSNTVIVSPGHPTNEQEFNQVISNPDNAPIVEKTTVIPSTTTTVAQGSAPVITQTELKQNKTFEDKSRRGDEAGTQRANAELNAMGISDSYSDIVKDNEGNYYRRSMRTGEWELIDRGEAEADTTPGSIDVNPPSSGVRIINLETGMSEPATNVNGEWVPESLIDLGGQESTVSTRTVYDPFQITANATDNYGKPTSYNAWVLNYDTPIVYEPGGKSYAPAMGPSGTKLDPWGSYDPTRGVFVVTANSRQKPGVDTLGEVMAGESDTFDISDDLVFFYGGSRLDEFASRAVGGVNKRTIVDVTREPTANKDGVIASYDIGSMSLSDFNLEDFKSMKDTVTAKTQTNTNSGGVITPAMRLAPPASTSVSKSSTDELPGYDVFGFHVPVIVPTWMQSGTSIGDALKPVQKPAYDINNWANSAEIAPYIYTAGIAVGMTDNPPGSVQAIDRVLSIVYKKTPGSTMITKAVNTGGKTADYVINMPGNSIKEYRVRWL